MKIILKILHFLSIIDLINLGHCILTKQETLAVNIIISLFDFSYIFIINTHFDLYTKVDKIVIDFHYYIVALYLWIVCGTKMIIIKKMFQT